MIVGSTGFLINCEKVACLAQNAQLPTIRTETREVVLPVEVAEERKDPKGLLTGANGETFHVYIVQSNEIRGLSSKSFHIFEDGAEQQIRHFSVEKLPVWVATDNIGQHEEYSCTPKGIWSGQDHEKIEISDADELFHTYLLTYAPRPSPAGSCHQIKIKVDHKHATVYAPRQYCNRTDPLSDPLNGTEIDNSLVHNVKSSQLETMSLAVQTSTFRRTLTNSSRINISAQFPASLIKREWRGAALKTSVVILGLIYDKTDALVSRFSDIACAPTKTEGFNGIVPAKDSDIPPQFLSWRKFFEDLVMPTSYQTQVDIPPGDYRLELVISDGEHFGKTTASVSVNDFTIGELAISGIALCRRYRKAPVEPRAPTQAPQYVPLVFDSIEFTPTGDMRFQKGEHFNAFFEIYGTQLEEAATTMFLQVRVLDAKTGVIKLDSGVQPLKLPTPKNNSNPVVKDVSTDSLPLGSYNLEIQVSDSQGRKTSWSSVSFAVE